MEDEREQQMEPSTAEQRAVSPAISPSSVPAHAQEPGAPELLPDEIVAAEEEETTRMSKLSLPNHAQPAQDQTSTLNAHTSHPAPQQSTPSPTFGAPMTPFSNPNSLTLADLPAQQPPPYSPPPHGGWSKTPMPPTGAPVQQPPQSQRPVHPSHIPVQASDSWGQAILRLDSTITMSANTAAGLSYLLWWVSGLFVYFNEKRNRYVRFHAMQSILLTGLLTVVAVLTYAITSICEIIAVSAHAPIFHVFSVTFAWLVIPLVIIAPWLAFMTAAWTGHYLRLPILSRYAERYAAPPYEPPSPTY